jgi:hypothetical protein
MALFTFALATTALFSLIFVPIFLAAWWQEEEHWRRQKLQLAVIPVTTDPR